MELNEIRKIAFKLRGGIWGALFVLILFFASPDVSRLCPGLFLVALGQTMRFWAAGSIVLYRGEKVGAKKLVTWGPYSLVRNPLYVANGLIGLGWAVIAGLSAIVAFFAVFVILYVWLIVPLEENFLRDLFPSDYDKYRAKVNAFIPKWPFTVRKGPFDKAVLWRSERHSLWVTLAGTAVLLSRFWW